MGKASRSKGVRFEQLVASLIRELFPGTTVRRSMQAERAFEPDVLVEAGEGSPTPLSSMWMELTHGDRPKLVDKLLQAERDVMTRGLHGHRHPVVVWRRTGERTIWATMRAVTMPVLFGASPAVLNQLWSPVDRVSSMPISMGFEQLLRALKDRLG